MSLDEEKSGVNIVIKKRIRLVSGGGSGTIAEPAPTDIVAVDDKLYLYRKGKPMDGQTPQDVKTVGGQTIFGEGDIPLPQKVSDLQNDSGFVTNLVSDLVNYYTSEQIDAKLSSLGDLKLKVVDALPEADKAEENVLYMLSSDYKVYAQYFWDEKGWHLVGTGNADLTNYYTKEEIDLLIKASALKVATEDAIGGIKSAKIDASADGERKYVKVEEDGLAYVKAAKVTDSPTAKTDVVDALNSDSGEDPVILFGGNGAGV